MLRGAKPSLVLPHARLLCGAMQDENLHTAASAELHAALMSAAEALCAVLEGRGRAALELASGADSFNALGFTATSCCAKCTEAGYAGCNSWFHRADEGRCRLKLHAVPDTAHEPNASYFSAGYSSLPLIESGSPASPQTGAVCHLERLRHSHSHSFISPTRNSKA